MRNFWFPRIHTVRGRTSEGFASWITKEEFIFESVVGSEEFTIKVLAPEAALSGLAHDCNKMAAAAFETFLELSDSNILPKSCAWINLTTYYGSFFAAHALLRLCGNICFQVEFPQKKALENIANLFYQLPEKGFNCGFYMGKFDTTSNEISFKRIVTGSSGSHNSMWAILNTELTRFSRELGESYLYTKSSRWLSSISSSLSQSQSGGWLSTMRNTINYKLSHGAWFPYKGLKTNKKDLLKIASEWTKDPLSIQIEFPDALKQQVATSTALVALCRTIVMDMHHLAGPTSFHAYGSASLLKQAKSYGC